MNYNKQFKFQESDDPCMYDDQYILKADENIYIQVSDKYIVNEYVEEEQSSYFKGEFISLNEAFKRAVDVYVSGI